MARRETFLVEVAYAKPGQQMLLSIEAEEGMTLAQVIERSGLLAQFPEIDLATSKVGIFSKLSKLDATVRARDRIEIYRPLIADPKAVRQQRAAEGKKMSRGGGDAAPEEEG
ncbi:MAG: RnfH family protein [Gammaproteobacteria bacterium]|nr:RnfH family protein [Gammaproteobacteria bacterium]